MNNKQERFSYLLKQYLADKCTKAELIEFLSIVKEDTTNHIESSFNTDELNTSLLDASIEFNKENIYHNLSQQIHVQKPNRLLFIKNYGLQAAAVLLITAALWFVIAKQNSLKQAPTYVKETDILPGGNRGTLTLADGRTIKLDSVKNGELAHQAGTDIIISNGNLLQYKLDHQTNNSTTSYNTLATPRGGQFKLILPDKTSVWLNAESTLKFPTVFSGKTRIVELTGEAYFEVAKNAKMPFKVISGTTTTEVLGTHFNINAYKNESLTKTTLLEGSVKVSNTKDSILLNPNQQAITTSTSQKIEISKEIDVDEVVAWKNGKFQFNNTDLQSIMRQLARWYDVEIVYEGAIPKRAFTGKISRDVTATQVLKILELSDINFRIDGKKIIVMP